MNKKPLGDTAARILHAADELLSERGPDAVSMQDIADRAGVNKALVFYHLGSKAELFERVLEGYYRAHAEALREAFEASGDVRTRLHRVLDAYIDFMASHQRYARLAHQLASGPDEYHPLIARGLKPLFDWTVEALSELTPAEGPLAARQFFLSFAALVTNTFTFGRALEPLWGAEAPSSPEGLPERRVHVHWMVDAVLDRLHAEQAAAAAAQAETRAAGAAGIRGG